MATSPPAVAPATSTANLSLDIEGYNFVNSGTTTPPKIYINNDELTTPHNSTDLSTLFTQLYTEYTKDPTHPKFVDLTGKLTTEFIQNNTPYAVRIQLQIVKNPKTSSPTKIAVNEAVIIEFEPYEIANLTTPSGGGRRRTKMSKRHSTYRTRKNKK